MLEHVTVIILPDGSHFAIKGELNLINTHKCTLIKTPTEDVNGLVVVHCYVIIPKR